jgi:hypothetical protein
MRLEDGETKFEGEGFNRWRGEFAAAASGAVWLGDDAEDLIVVSEGL